MLLMCREQTALNLAISANADYEVVLVALLEFARMMSSSVK